MKKYIFPAILIIMLAFQVVVLVDALRNDEKIYQVEIKDIEKIVDLIDKVTKLEQYKTSTESIISGLNDEIRELRAITDEFRAQIKGLQKEVLIGIQEGGM